MGRCNYENPETSAKHEEMLDQMALELDMCRKRNGVNANGSWTVQGTATT